MKDMSRPLTSHSVNTHTPLTDSTSDTLFSLPVSLDSSHVQKHCCCASLSEQMYPGALHSPISVFPQRTDSNCSCKPHCCHSLGLNDIRISGYIFFFSIISINTCQEHVKLISVIFNMKKNT